MKSALIRLGIRGFNPKLKKAAERLEDLRTPEGEPIPPNTLAELHRDMTRRRLVSDQMRQIENARQERLDQAPSDGPKAMVRLLARVIGVGIETADMLVQEVLSRNLRDRPVQHRRSQRNRPPSWHESGDVAYVIAGVASSSEADTVPPQRWPQKRRWDDKFSQLYLQSFGSSPDRDLRCFIYF